jgi:AraC-like DNA-binding protein
MSLALRVAKFSAGLDHSNANEALLTYWDLELVCQYANDTVEKWFEKKQDELVDNVSLYELFGYFLFHHIYGQIEAVMQGEQPVFEKLITLPSGIIKKAKVTLGPDKKNNEVIGFFLHISEVRPKELAIVAAEAGYSANEKHLALPYNHYLADVVETLESNILTEFPGIENISKKHNVSSSRLKREFKKQYNTTIFSYYRRLQMDLAFDYIIQKKANKKQMALMFNFSNPSNFLSCYNNYLKEKEKHSLPAETIGASDNPYKIFIEQAPVALAMVDKELRFITVSQKWCADFNILYDDVAGKKMPEVLPCFAMHKNTFSDCLENNIERCIENIGSNPDENSGYSKLIVKQWHNENEVGGLMIIAEN